MSSGGMYTQRLELGDPNWKERDYDGVLLDCVLDPALERLEDVTDAVVVDDERTAGQFLGALDDVPAGLQPFVAHVGNFAAAPGIDKKLPDADFPILLEPTPDQISRRPSRHGPHGNEGRSFSWGGSLSRTGQCSGHKRK